MIHSQVFSPAVSSAALAESVQYAKFLLQDLTEKQWLGTELPIVNPPLWELGHMTWFTEFFCLREANPNKASRITQGDFWYNSATMHHDKRWQQDYISPEETIDYCDKVLADVQEKIFAEGNNQNFAYFVLLSLFHHDMHNEALLYSRQTHAYPALPGTPSLRPLPPGEWLRFSGGQFRQGQKSNGKVFVFDNEKPEHWVEVAAFQLSSTPVRQSEFLAFVAAGGYQVRDYWSESGWLWLKNQGRSLPRYWRKATETTNASDFEQRVFAHWQPLIADLPMQHVNFYEAEAYAKFADARLPSEREWEYAAGQITLPHQQVWEWTSSRFLPYPGFCADAYRTYSEPWFGSRYVLRGQSLFTSKRLISRHYRNFFTPERDDIFAGIRLAKDI